MPYLKNKGISNGVISFLGKVGHTHTHTHTHTLGHTGELAKEKICTWSREVVKRFQSVVGLTGFAILFEEVS